VFTDPFSGQFSVNLVQNQAYVVVTNAISPGYATSTSGITATSTALDLQLTTTGDCTAPGYTDNSLLLETFDSLNAPTLPAGWSETLINASQSHWTTASNIYEAVPSFSLPNAMMFTAAGGNSFTDLTYNTNLNLQSRNSASISFWLYQTDKNPDSHDTIQAFVDDGVNWETVDRPYERYSNSPGWKFFRIDISRFVGAGKPAIRFGFRAFSGTPPLNKILIDNIRLGNATCTAVPGGLIAGYILDSHGGGVSQARVYRAAAPSTDYTYSFTTPNDINTADGLYLLFSGTMGNNDLTVVQPRFNPKTSSVNTSSETISRLDIMLENADFNFTPSPITIEVVGSGGINQNLQITNFGLNSGNVWLNDTSTTWPNAADNHLESTPLYSTFLNDSLTQLPIHMPSGATGFTPTMPENTLKTTPANPLALPLLPTSYATPIPGNARLRTAIASCDGRSFYLFGGQDASKAFLNETLKFDTALDSWTHKANMPLALMNMNAACLDKTIYLVGGYNSNFGGYTNDLLMYDTITDIWARTTWPHARTPMLAAYKGTLYAFGGAPINKETYAYTPTSGWTKKADMPTAISFGSAVVVDNYIYIVGGVDSGGSALATVQRYNPATNTWESNGPDLPEGRSNTSAVWYGDHTIYLLSSGGRSGDAWAAWNDGLVYDTSLWPNGTWSRLPGGIVSTPMDASAGICVGGRIWQIGGVDANSAAATFNVYRNNQFLDHGLTCHTSLPAMPWLTLSTNNLSLGSASSSPITLTFNGSAVTKPGLYRGLLRINSDSPFSYPDIPVQMVRVEKGTGITITPQSGSGKGHPSKTVTYTFTITNSSAGSINFPITVANQIIPSGWSVNIFPPSTGILAPAASTQISVKVTLPASGVANYTIFPLNLSIGSSLDPDNFGTATFITTYSPYTILLPRISR